MSTLRVTTVTNPSGGQPTIDGLAKAWVNFNGTGTVAIRASLNVSSITDNGTGLYQVNLTNALTDANYSINISATAPSGQNISGTNPNNTISGSVNVVAPTTTAFRIMLNNTNIDSEYVYAVVFR